MAKSFSLNSNNDIFIGLDGLLSISNDLEAVLQDCATAAKAQLGEMILSIDQGVPNFQTIWQSAANVAQFEAFLRRTILRVSGVTEIKSLSVVVRDNTLFYTAEIVTIYGQGALTNG